jgi:hypothetical protein
MIRQRMIAGLLTATALVAFAACGSDSTSSNTEHATSTSSATTATTATIAKAGSATTTSLGATDATGTSLVLTGSCTKYQDEYTKLSSSDHLDPDAVKSFLSELAHDVPSDLKDDVQSLSDALLPLANAMKTAGTDPTKAAQDPDVQKALQAMSDPEVRSASDAMTKWFHDGCPS